MRSRSCDETGETRTLAEQATSSRPLSAVRKGAASMDLHSLRSARHFALPSAFRTISPVQGQHSVPLAPPLHRSVRCAVQLSVQSRPTAQFSMRHHRFSVGCAHSTAPVLSVSELDSKRSPTPRTTALTCKSQSSRCETVATCCRCVRSGSRGFQGSCTTRVQPGKPCGSSPSRWSSSGTLSESQRRQLPPKRLVSSEHSQPLSGQMRQLSARTANISPALIWPVLLLMWRVIVIGSTPAIRQTATSPSQRRATHSSRRQ